MFYFKNYNKIQLIYPGSITDNAVADDKRHTRLLGRRQREHNGLLAHSFLSGEYITSILFTGSSLVRRKHAELDKSLKTQVKLKFVVNKPKFI